MMVDDNDGQMIFGDLGGLKLTDICLTGEANTRKNLTQETCPDRGSNPGPLRDKRTFFHLLHSGGRLRVPTLFHCVLFSNSCPSPRRLQRPIAQGQSHRSSGRSVFMYKVVTSRRFNSYIRIIYPEIYVLEILISIIQAK